MATSYLTPGVYVEEVPAQSKPIEGVSTSVAAFVGLAPGGPVNTPVRISNFTEFSKVFGDPAAPDNGPFMTGAYLAHSVYGFFQNGGSLCWIVRVGAPDEAPAAVAALPAATDDAVQPFTLTAKPEVKGPVTVKVEEEPVAGDEKGGEKTYRIVVTAGDVTEDFPGLSLGKKGRTSLATKVASKLIIIEESSATLTDEQRAPKVGIYTLTVPAPASSELSSGEFEGNPARREGIGSLVAIDEISIVCVPDAVNLIGEDQEAFKDLQGKLIAHCENTGDRMVILDPPNDLRPQDILDWRNDTAGYDSKFATLYWPWIQVMDPLSKESMMIPPSGHVAGVWSRTDDTRGVHKAPANEVVMGANSLAFQITSAEQGALNQAGINCIRAFTGRGIRIWGARTLSSDPEWRYINVRRLFNYVSQSIMEGTQWSVFEPNDQALWFKLQASVGSFLNRTWRSGALFGSSEGQAFFVKCDGETNPQDIIDAGQVICEIGISPVKPAEFVIFRLSQFAEGGGGGGE
jgi:phage tail sheath protein FI